jgi:fructokinase
VLSVLGKFLVALIPGPSADAGPGRPLLHRTPLRVTVADTVGADGSLAAGLLSGLLEAGVTPRAEPAAARGSLAGR